MDQSPQCTIAFRHSRTSLSICVEGFSCASFGKRKNLPLQNLDRIILPPFEYRRAWHIAQPLDLKVLKSAAKHFVGTHDFTSFAANRGKPERSTIRTINSVRVRQKGPCVTIEFDGDGFLYKMVRLIVGALVKCAFGKMRIEEIVSRLDSGKVRSARFAAPAEGLYLVRVRY